MSNKVFYAISTLLLATVLGVLFFSFNDDSNTEQYQPPTQPDQGIRISP